jgi:1,4-alpha-glucan branching enzyme
VGSAEAADETERRAKLAFVCLLTSMGVPMIFAGEEFGEERYSSWESHRVSDYIDWERLSDLKHDWRRRLFEYVSTLVRLRTTCPALHVNDTEFIYFDRSRDSRIVAWMRGQGTKTPVVVVANFSDEDTPGPQYVVPNWPPSVRHGCRDVTQGRDVPDKWVGREPLLRWEAKFYTSWRA